MSIQEILKILTDSGIEPNEANVEVKMLLEHFADYGFKDIIAGKKLTADKIAIVKEKALLRAKTRQPIQHIAEASVKLLFDILCLLYTSPSPRDS